MSYCRFGKDSNIYLFPHTSGRLECCGCWLAEGSVTLATLEQALGHLREHLEAGHLVPQRAINRLCEEMEIEMPEDLRDVAKGLVRNWWLEKKGDLNESILPQSKDT